MQQRRQAALGGLLVGVANELNIPINNGLMAVTTMSDLVSARRIALERGIKRSLSICV